MKQAVILMATSLVIMAMQGVGGNGTSRKGTYPIIKQRRTVNFPDYVTEDHAMPWPWPMPVSVTNGAGTLTLAKNFGFGTADGKPPLEILAQAFTRYNDIIFKQHTLYNGSVAADGPFLEKLVVSLGSPDEELQYGGDESYTLNVPSPSKPTTALLKAETVYGALRGLETFSQLAAFNFRTRTVQILGIPWAIRDYPRFAFRGLLIDTSRHYQPLESIRRIIDSMAYAKLNVLHWHIVDEESFPLEIPSYPRLWMGAYTYGERYTMDDARTIVEYARARGIHVMAELDVPGHAASWGMGYPELWPTPACNEPLDVSKEVTFNVIDGIIADFKKVFPFKFVHLGGDEVDTSCWRDTPHIQAWLQLNNFTAPDAYASFVLRTQGIALKHGYLPVNWEETFNTFPSRLSKETVVHNWLESGTCPRVVKYGLKCILSDQGTWYLDHLDVPWDKFYLTEPLLNIIDPDEQKLVIGGEVCMWGETADASNVLQTIWPRAAAAAERLWSPRPITDQGAAQAFKRLQSFHCLLDQRGIPAAPLLYGDYLAPGRTAPSGPGSCFEQ